MIYSGRSYIVIEYSTRDVYFTRQELLFEYGFSAAWLGE